MCSRFSDNYLITYAWEGGNHSKVELLISTELQTTIIAVLLGDGNYKRLPSKIIQCFLGSKYHQPRWQKILSLTHRESYVWLKNQHILKPTPFKVHLILKNWLEAPCFQLCIYISGWKQPFPLPFNEAEPISPSLCISQVNSVVFSPCNLLHPLFVSISQPFIKLFTDFSSVYSQQIHRAEWNRKVTGNKITLNCKKKYLYIYTNIKKIRLQEWYYKQNHCYL